MFVSRKDRPDGGFTLVEVLVSLGVMSLLLMGVLGFLETNVRIARSQVGVSEMQQSARGAQRELVRILRSLGRGGLPAGFSSSEPGVVGLPSYRLPQGLSVSVLDDVDPDSLSLPLGSVVEGTDVLRVRGVLTLPIYQLDPADSDSFVDLEDGTNTALLRLGAFGPAGVPQDLEPLLWLIEEAKSEGGEVIPEAIVVVGSDSETFGVLELDPAASQVGLDSAGRTLLELRLRYHDLADPGATSGRVAEDYGRLSPGGGFPMELFQMGLVSAGILEDYVFYVREERAVPGDPTSEAAPRLTRGRLCPGADAAWAGDLAELEVDLAYQVLDLQVALGFDTPNGGSWSDDADDAGTDDAIYESIDGVDDDWLANSVADDPTEAPWITAEPWDLYYLRFSLLLRTRLRDPDHTSPLLDRIENRVYGPSDPLNSLDQRRFRRRVQTSIVDMRNL